MSLPFCFAAAVGKPDSHAGELPVAYVQLVPGSRATSSELIEYLTARIAERADHTEGNPDRRPAPADAYRKTRQGSPAAGDCRAHVWFDAFGGDWPFVRQWSAECFRAAGPEARHAGLDRGDIAAVTNRAVLAADIKGVMDQFAFPYDIDWREDDAV
jgi:hypothetical protein